MKFLELLMIANVFLLISALATKGGVRAFLFKLWGIVFVIAIITVGFFVNNGTLRN